MDWDELAQIAAFDFAFVQHEFPYGVVGAASFAFLQAVTVHQLSNASLPTHRSSLRGFTCQFDACLTVPVLTRAGVVDIDTDTAFACAGSRTRSSRADARA
jgi:hypothetical protein